MTGYRGLSARQVVLDEANDFGPANQQTSDPSRDLFDAMQGVPMGRIRGKSMCIRCGLTKWACNVMDHLDGPRTLVCDDCLDEVRP